MGPTIAVGEAERGGDWGVRVGSATPHQRISDQAALAASFRGGLCLSDERDSDSDSDEDESLQSHGSATLTQRLLWLRHVKQLNNSRRKCVQSLSPQPHASHQSPNYSELPTNPAQLLLNNNSSSYTTSEDGNANCSSSAKNVVKKGSRNNQSLSPRSPSIPSSPSTDTSDKRFVGHNSRGRNQLSLSHQHLYDGDDSSPPPHHPDEGDIPAAGSGTSPQKRFFSGSRPISSLARPLVALAVPGMFLVCKYHQYRRQHQEAARRRAAERELHHLNHKIVRHSLQGRII